MRRERNDSSAMHYYQNKPGEYSMIVRMVSHKSSIFSNDKMLLEIVFKKLQ